MARPVESHHTVATCLAALRANGPMIAPDLAEVVGMRRKSSDWIRALLRQHPDVVTRHRTIRKAGAGLSRAEFFAFEAFPPEPPRITDLWRGWRDPVTGYQPARLGLDPAPEGA